jgi:hypothetical protein
VRIDHYSQGCSRRPSIVGNSSRQQRIIGSGSAATDNDRIDSATQLMNGLAACL